MAKYQPRHTKKEKFENMPYKTKIITMIDAIKNNEPIVDPVEIKEKPKKSKLTDEAKEKAFIGIMKIIAFIIFIPIVLAIGFLKLLMYITAALFGALAGCKSGLKYYKN